LSWRVWNRREHERRKVAGTLAPWSLRGGAQILITGSSPLAPRAPVAAAMEIEATECVRRQRPPRSLMRPAAHAPPPPLAARPPADAARPARPAA
jgi:hypothetical protein